MEMLSYDSAQSGVTLEARGDKECGPYETEHTLNEIMAYDKDGLYLQASGSMRTV